MAVRQNSLLVLLVLVVGISVFGEQHVARAFTVANNMQSEPIVILGSSACVQCPSVFLEAGKAVTLDREVPQYPQTSLKFQLSEDLYCVQDARMTNSATLTIGPNNCGRGFAMIGLQATLQGTPFCLPKCTI